MNGYQEITISVTMAAIVLMVVSAPWEETFTSIRDGSAARFLAGRAGMSSPLQAKNTWTRMGLCFRMLILQWASVAGIAGSTIMRFTGKQPRNTLIGPDQGESPSGPHHTPATKSSGSVSSDAGFLKKAS